MFGGRVTIGAAGMALLLGSGCALNQESADARAAPSGLSSSAALASDQSRSDSWTYVAPNVDLSRYRRFMLLPAEVYRGADADFGSADSGRQQSSAAVLTAELRQVIDRKSTRLNSSH